MRDHFEKIAKREIKKKIIKILSVTKLIHIQNITFYIYDSIKYINTFFKFHFIILIFNKSGNKMSFFKELMDIDKK